jgi:hypothetical protein
VRESETRVNAFLSSYRKAFEQLDAPRIAGHFAYPAHVTSDAEEISLTPVATGEQWLPQLERLIALYRTIGFRSARVVETNIIELSPRLLQAAVRWELLDSAGSPLYAFDASYTLVEAEGDLRIAALAHNELPPLRACLAQRSSRRA